MISKREKPEGWPRAANSAPFQPMTPACPSPTPVKKSGRQSPLAPGAPLSCEDGMRTGRPGAFASRQTRDRRLR